MTPTFRDSRRSPRNALGLSQADDLDKSFALSIARSLDIVWRNGETWDGRNGDVDFVGG